MDSIVVFDMGGVLYDFRGDRMIARASRRRFRRAEEHDTWLPLLARFETGACSAREFAERAVLVCDLNLDPSQFLAAFRAAAFGFYAGALGMLAALGERRQLLSLSNTNELQWSKVIEDLGPSDPFHGHHPSHLSGFHKPDPQAFTAIAKQHPGAEFYFFDDRPQNVAAAIEIGWQARRVRGVAEARAACTELGLLDA